MGKGSPVVVLRLPRALIEMVGEVVDNVNRRHPKREYTKSDFIREAIREKLAHRARSKKTRIGKRFKCFQCEVSSPITELAWERKLITGETEYCCADCDRVGKIDAIFAPG